MSVVPIGRDCAILDRFEGRGRERLLPGAREHLEALDDPSSRPGIPSSSCLCLSSLEKFSQLGRGSPTLLCCRGAKPAERAQLRR